MIKSIRSNFIETVLDVLPDSFYVRLKKKHPIVSFLYHTVSNEELPHIKNLYRYKNEREFENDLDFLLKEYIPYDPNDGFESIAVKKKPQMLLTFDDGLRECYDVIAPILIKKGVPAIFFINSGFVDNKDLFYRFKVSLIIENIKTSFPKYISEFSSFNLSQSVTYLKSLNYNHINLINDIIKKVSIDVESFLGNYKPYMSKMQILDLRRMGFSIGAHSIDHPYFKDISSDEQIRQVKESMNYIRNELNIDYKYYAFPFSSFGVCKEVFGLSEGEDNEVDVFFGTSGFNKLGRLTQERIDLETSLCIKKTLKKRYLFHELKQIF